MLRLTHRDCVTDAGLRFSDDVLVETRYLMPLELKGPDADQYEIIGTKTTCRLAQRPASYVVIQYDRPPNSITSYAVEYWRWMRHRSRLAKAS